MASIEALAGTLRKLAVSGMKPKDLLAAVRQQHPEATKKEVVRAAFYALIESHGTSPEQAQSLHSFAIGGRAVDEEQDVRPAKLRGKKGKRAPEGGSAAH